MNLIFYYLKCIMHLLFRGIKCLQALMIYYDLKSLIPIHGGMYLLTEIVYATIDNVDLIGKLYFLDIFF